MTKQIAILCLGVLFFLSSYGQESRSISTADFSRDTVTVNSLIKQIPKMRHVATDSAIRLLLRTYQMSHEIGYAKGVASSLVNLGLMYMDKGEYDKSLAFYRKAMPYCQIVALEQPKALILLYNNIAALYGNRNVYDTAAMYYYKALDKYDSYKLKDTALLLTIYNNLAARLTILERISNAKFYLQKAVPLALATRNNAMLAKSYVAYSGIYTLEKNIDSTRKYAHKALQIFDTIKDPGSHVSAYCNLAESYLQQKKPKEALAIYYKAIEKNRSASDLTLAPAHRGLGRCYYELKDFERAEYHYLLALKEAKRINSSSGQKAAFKALVDINTAKEDYRKALEYRNQYADLIEADMNEERMKTFGQLEVKYRTAQKDKELAQNKLLLSEQSHQLQNKNILLVTVCMCSLLVILLIFNIYRSRKQRESFQLKALRSEKELTQLKATMQGEEKERKRIARELHDGIMIQFSSVKMNLSALAQTEDGLHSDKMDCIIDSLDEAIRDLRKSAHNLMPDMLLKEGLAEALHYFCVKLQEGTGTEIEFQSYGDLPKIAPEYELMLYRMVQELMQNTLKHAHAAKALVQLNFQPDMIGITVEDDGIGFDFEKDFSYKGIGLRQIKERIAFLCGQFHVNSNQPNGTSIYIELETKFLQGTNAELQTH